MRVTVASHDCRGVRQLGSVFNIMFRLTAKNIKASAKLPALCEQQQEDRCHVYSHMRCDRLYLTSQSDSWVKNYPVC